MFGRKDKALNLMRTTSRELGTALDRIGMSWSLDKDGDIRIRTRSNAQPWTDPVFYELDPSSSNFRVRGQFLKGRRLQQEGGYSQWEVLPGQDYAPTAIAQKVVTVYLSPRSGHVDVQIHAAVEPMNQARNLSINVIPSPTQVATIEGKFGWLSGVEQSSPDGSKELWLSGSMGESRVNDEVLHQLIQWLFSAGLAMFDGPFTGWQHVDELVSSQ